MRHGGGRYTSCLPVLELLLISMICAAGWVAAWIAGPGTVATPPPIDPASAAMLRATFGDENKTNDDVKNPPLEEVAQD